MVWEDCQMSSSYQTADMFSFKKIPAERKSLTFQRVSESHSSHHVRYSTQPTTTKKKKKKPCCSLQSLHSLLWFKSIAVDKLSTADSDGSVGTPNSRELFTWRGATQRQRGQTSNIHTLPFKKKKKKKKELAGRYCNIKGAVCSSEEDIRIEKMSDWLTNKPHFDYRKWLHNLYCFYFVYMWRTLPPFSASNGVLGTLFSSENSVYSVCKR